MSESQSLPAVPKKFEYEPLDLSKQQIRLLTLHSALSKGDPIECRLEAFDTDSCPEYVALSYVWGPPSPTRAISVNGQSFVVRQNLFDFLLIYRDDSNNTHYIWIDQICISQAHTAERNHQVQLMSIIYTKSLWTLSWLGFEQQQSAFQFVSLCQSVEPDRDRVRLAQRILNGKYFQRLWIVQEILLACTVRMLCGNVWIELEDLFLYAEDHTEIGSHLGLHKAAVGLVKAVENSSRALSLIDSIRFFWTHECENPRDKVYGLTGLMREKLVVDYSKTVVEVFLDVLLALAKSGTLINPLRLDYSLPFVPWYDAILNLLTKMGLQQHEGAFCKLWHDLADNHVHANPKRWADRWQRRYDDSIENWNMSSGWAEPADDDFDRKGRVIPFSALGFVPGKDERSGKWWYTWRGITWFYVVGEWEKGKDWKGVRVFHSALDQERAAFDMNHTYVGRRTPSELSS